MNGQTLQAGESMSLSVLFLARDEGAVFGKLIVETSVGGFIVQVMLFAGIHCLSMVWQSSADVSVYVHVWPYSSSGVVDLHARAIAAWR